MALKERLNEDLKSAMRLSDEVRRTALRQLLAGIRQAALDKRSAAARQMGRSGELSSGDIAELERTSLDDAEVLAAIQKEAKALREAIADAQKANRPDLAAASEAELRVVEDYLPRQLTREEIEALAQAAIAETGATDVKQLGAVMKVLAPRVKGQADGRLVNEVVRDLLAR